MKKTGKQSANQSFNKDCVLYYRISSTPQETARQKAECLDFCQNNGYNIVCEPFEEPKSGRKENRKIMTECLNYIKDNDIHYLVIAEISRLSRSLEGSEIIRRLTADRVCVIGILDGIKTLDDNFNEDREMTARASQAVTDSIKESNRIGARVSRGKRTKVLTEGHWWGGIYLPYGYVSNKGVLTIDPKEAEYVKLIFEKYLNGWGSIKISNWLNMEGIPTKLKSQWSRSTINQMLPHTLYIGKRVFKGQELETPELRIIDDNTFFAVQERMKARKNTDKTFNQLKKYDYLFTGLLKCGVCGRSFYGLYRDNLYKCSSGKYHRGCGCESIKIDWLDLYVQQYIAVNQFKLLYDNTKAVQLNEQLEIDLRLLQEEQSKYEQEQQRFNMMFQKGRIKTEAEYDSLSGSNDKQLLRIQNSIKALRAQQSQYKPIVEQVLIKGLMTLNEQTNHYDYEKIEIDRDTVHSIISKIIIHKKVSQGQLIEVQLMNGQSFSLLNNNHKPLIINKI